MPCSPTCSKSHKTPIHGENWVTFSAQWLSTHVAGTEDHLFLWKYILRRGESRSVTGRRVKHLLRPLWMQRRQRDCRLARQEAADRAAMIMLSPCRISLLVCLHPSLTTSVVPTSFKKSVIIPEPKNSKPSCLNDYRPVALTLTVMKVFERLLKRHICSSIPATLDPLQFAARKINWRCHLSGPALFPYTHWQQKWQLCQAAFHWLQLSFQYNSPHQASC